MISEQSWQRMRARDKRVRRLLLMAAFVPLCAVLATTLWLVAYWWSH